MQNQVVVQAHRSGTVAQVEVLTLGSPSLDFSIPPSPDFSCKGALLVAGTGACSQSIVFTPTFPGLRAGAIVLLDSSGVELGAALLSGTGSAGLGVLVPGNTITVAGVYRDWTSSEDNIPATAANLDQPSSLVFDGAGNLFIADSAHNRIRKVTAPVPPATMGTISTIAGTGDGAYQGDGVPALSTPLNTPSGLAIDGAGNLYIADTLNNRIRKVDAVTSIITTVAGSGAPGSATQVGDGGSAIQANLNQPQGVTVDANGNLYIADTANQRIRRVDAITGLITTVAGDGQPSANGDGKGTYTGDGGPAAQAGLSLPYAVAFDSSGNMYIPDSANNVIRMVNSAGTISTVQMPGGHTLNTPSGVAVDAAGNLYIADTQNSCIRKLNFAAGTLVALTFNGANVVSPAGIPGSAQIYAPMGLWIDGTGNVYFADFYDMLVEEIQSSVSVLNYTGTPVRQGQQSAPQYQVLENDGNLPLTLGSVTLDANAAVNAAKSSCPDGSPTLAINSGCLVAAIFAPSAAGDPLLGNIDVDDVSVNPRLDIVLVGNATAVNSTVTTLASNPNPSAFGAPVALAATITTGANTGNLTGTVSFYDGATLLASQVKVATPSVTVGTTTTTTAGFTTASLAVGTHALTAFYDNTNDPTHFSSTSTPAVNQVVREGTSTVLVSTANPSAIGQNVTVALTASGTAAFSTATLANGPHAITAAYSGDLAIQVSPSVSASLGQDVLAPSVAVVTSAPNPSSFGNPVTFAVVVTSNGGAVPAGSVALVDGARQIDSMTLDSTTGSGAFTLSSLAVGPHPITASYAGDPYNRSSVSPSITQIVSQAQTATAASANPNPAVVGAEVSISAAVKAIQGVSSPSGTVQFTDGATANLGTVPLSASGTAAISPALAIGAHSIVSAYSGDTNDSASTSAPLVLAVQQAVTSAQIASSPNPSVVDTAATFTASVSGNGGTPTGTVNFFADGLSIGSSTLSAKGIATLAYSGLTSGTHAVKATYAGDTNDQPSTSSAISQIVGTIPTVTALASSGTPGPNSEVVLLSTVVGASGPTPTGSITFTTGTTTLGGRRL
ncbi:MAG: Ig-like domain repeat protein [Terracidiphilus sp.]